MKNLSINEEIEVIDDTIFSDIADGKKDAEYLKGDTAILDLPEVKDIPGQEHIRVMPLGEMSDITISSDDEEGVGLLDDINEPEQEEDVEEEGIIDEDADAAISDTEIALLDQEELMETDSDSDNLMRSNLDNTDPDGTPLNEGSSLHNHAGDDLDIPGSELDDEEEETGAEDEENNLYSQADTD